MNNKFKIEQISTDQFVLRRNVEGLSEYITDTLDLIVLGSIGSHSEVVFGSLETAVKTLNTYNSKQLLDEMREDKPNLSIKSIKFNYKINKDGSESAVGVDSKAWEYLKSNSKDAVYTVNTSGFEEVAANNKFS
jgi:hypothetical protein